METKKQVKENIPGTCQRCKGEIKPFEPCCILGYNSKKGEHPRDKCDEIICYRCINALDFEYNAVHVSGNNSQPTFFWDIKEIEKCQKIEQEIDQKLSTNKKKSQHERNMKKHRQ